MTLNPPMILNHWNQKCVCGHRKGSHKVALANSSIGHCCMRVKDVLCQCKAFVKARKQENASTQS